MSSNSETFFIIFIISLCSLLFAFIWLIMLFLVSYFGGWNKLYQKYKFPDRIKNPIKTKSFQSIQLGMSNYNGIMKLSYYPEGIGLEVMILFRFRHPKLFIPWKDIRLKEKSKSIFVWNKLEIGNPTLAIISVNDKLLEEFNTYLVGISNKEDDRW
jgi:hypothetical protein